MTSDSEISEVPDSPNELKMYRYWLAFASMGFLVGNIAGLTSAPITQPLLAAVLAFGGGSIIAFQTKLNKERLLPGALHAVTAFSLFALLGIYMGILVSEYQLLSPVNNIADNKTSDSIDNKNPYLRSSVSRKIDELEDEVIAGIKTKPQAFDELVDLLKDAK